MPVFTDAKQAGLLVSELEKIADDLMFKSLTLQRVFTRLKDVWARSILSVGKLRQTVMKAEMMATSTDKDNFASGLLAICKRSTSLIVEEQQNKQKQKQQNLLALAIKDVILAKYLYDGNNGRVPPEIQRAAAAIENKIEKTAPLAQTRERGNNGFGMEGFWSAEMLYTLPALVYLLGSAVFELVSWRT